MVNTPIQNMPFSQTKILGLILLLGGLALVGLGLSWLLSTPQFQATARIKVETDFGPDLNDGSAPEAYDPYFINTTFEILQSQVVLSNVVSALNLDALWGKKFANDKKLSFTEVIDLLKQRMTLAPVRGTKIVIIGVRSDDPTEAANIANAISDAYAHYCEESRRRRHIEDLEVLHQEYAEQIQKIATLQTNAEALRQQLGITEQLNEAHSDANNINNQPYYETKRKLAELMKQHEIISNKLEAIRLDSQMINDSMVQIIDFATPPTSPIGPNRFLGAVMLTVGLITAVGGWGLLMRSEHKAG